MWVVREGYEGLVRGNQEQGERAGEEVNKKSRQEVKEEYDIASKAFLKKQGIKPNTEFLQNLRFGDGDLLRDGTSEYVGGRTLKGRYIVRVGWDDVRGWFAEVSLVVISATPGGLI